MALCTIKARKNVKNILKPKIFRQSQAFAVENLDSQLCHTVLATSNKGVCVCVCVCVCVFIYVSDTIQYKLKPPPFSRPRLKTVTSFRLTPRPLLMVTASVASFLKPLRMDPLEWALRDTKQSEFKRPTTTELRQCQTHSGHQSAGLK